jgi:xylan 1,4-beta-xylosidase
MQTIITVLVVLGMCAAMASASARTVQVNANPAAGTKFDHFWKESVGSGHALLGTRADWQAQLKQAVSDIGLKRVRMHGIFDDDMSVVLAPGQYEFYNVDIVYDFLLSIGVRPIVELSFMPGVLAGCWPWNNTGAKCNYVMHYDGIVQPPTNFADWQDLCRALAAHLVERYGVEEVRHWHFEVWNELWGMAYPHPYLDLYQAAYDGIKSVDKELKVGGPATMQCQWVKEFAADTQGRYDFISTHLYPTDPNCTWPAPGYSDIDCFANTIIDAHSKVPAGKPFLLTEFNAGLGNIELLYSSYAAAFVFRNLPQLEGILDVWSYWTFTDVFEENGMHSAPFEGYNYGIQTVQGIKKPAYRAYELLKTAGTSKLATAIVGGSGANETVTAFTTFDNASKTTSVFASNFAPQFFAITEESIVVTLSSSSTSNCSTAYLPFATYTLIGGSSGDIHAAWVSMGSPAYPTPAEIKTLELASIPYSASIPIVQSGLTCTVTLQLPAYSVARIDFLSP